MLVEGQVCLSAQHPSSCRLGWNWNTELGGARWEDTHLAPQLGWFWRVAVIKELWKFQRAFVDAVLASVTDKIAAYLSSG